MLNLFSDEVRRDPFPLYDQIRSASPVLHVPEIDCWMIFDYVGVKQALADHDAFSNNLAVASRGNPDWLIFYDPPRHTRLRNIIARAFTPGAIAELEPRIRALSRELLDAQVGRGEMDLAGDYAVPLPMRVIAEMTGIPPADWQRFKRWADAILKLSYDLTGGDAANEGIAEYAAATGEMTMYLPDLVELRRKSPQDDLLTRLIAAEVDGERLTPKELLGFVQLLIVAGQETTANLINGAILSLLENPDQLARLRERTELLPSAIEEALRYRSPIQWMFRATTRDVQLHGQVIPAGKLVLAVIGAANRDPRQFPAANRFDIARDPNPHIAFGHGIHFCLGAPLARLEARIALTDLLKRLPNLELAGPEPWQPRKALHVYGPSSLPVRFGGA
jgi:cytochrome P450